MSLTQSLPAPSDPRLKLLRLLSLLRWLAIVGQSAAILVALEWMGLPFAPLPLWSGVLVLLVFNAGVALLRSPSASAAGVWLGVHLGVDIAVLTWLLIWSGGIANPFVSLYLMPIALVAVAMSWRWALGVGTACLFAYAAVAALALALPLGGAGAHPGHEIPMCSGLSLQSLDGDLQEREEGVRLLDFDLHLWGMGVNFVISALLFVLALGTLARTLGERERELSRLREQAARNEGIVALGAHAAALAHALNTPLGSMQLILDDFGIGTDPAEAEQDLRVLRDLAGECRERVRSLVAHAQSMAPTGLPANVFIGEVVERWRLLRPGVSLQVEGCAQPLPEIRAEPLLEHLLLALLNNAAEASQEAGEQAVELECGADAELLCLRVRDRGPGLGSAAAQRLRTLFATSKPQGLGLGLALSHATVELFGGSLNLRAHPQGGSEAEVRLPLRALQSERPA
ncbi:MAG: ATP-binding protein [Aquimonas sp.]|nr:ATP-binding protein [Aquimonas sp.]